MRVGLPPVGPVGDGIETTKPILAPVWPFQRVMRLLPLSETHHESVGLAARPHGFFMFESFATPETASSNRPQRAASLRRSWVRSGSRDREPPRTLDLAWYSFCLKSSRRPLVKSKTSRVLPPTLPTVLLISLRRERELGTMPSVTWGAACEPLVQAAIP
jgi:hypothetical protein